MCNNNSIDELNNRLSDLRVILDEFLELTRMLAQTQEEFADFGVFSPSYPETLTQLYHLVPQLEADYQVFQASITTYGNDFDHRLLWTPEEVNEAYGILNSRLFQIEEYIQQLNAIVQNQRRLVLKSRLEQIAQLILTLESTIQIARSRLTLNTPQFIDYSEQLRRLETMNRYFQRSLQLYEMISDQTPFTLENTVALFSELRELTSTIQASTELAELICIDLLNQG
jgi:hypothetical protein